MNLFVKYLLVISFSGAAAQSAPASGYVSEQDYLQEFPVVLSASRLSQPLSEAPNAMTIIDRTMIKASGFRTIADLFRLVPGMYVGAENGYSPIVAYHGSLDQFSRQMQVLVDGRSVYLPPYSTVSWADIPLHLSDIERIEVVRGPAAASHGANSFQGVINIITRDATGTDGNTVSVAKGNGGIADASAHLVKTGAVADYRVTLAYRADRGYDTAVLNDSSATRLASLRANFHPNVTDSFDVQLGYSEGARQEGIAGRVTDPFDDVRVSANFQQLTWLHALPHFDEFKLNYYHIYRKSRDESGSVASNLVAHRQELELQHTVHVAVDNRLVWGGGVRSDSAEAPYSMSNSQTLHQSRLFAHDEWRMSESAILNAGAMLENDGFGHRNTSPRAALNYHLTPQQTLRAGASVAYRSPALLEEKIDIPTLYHSLGGLRPERIYSRELGYLGEFNMLGLTVDAKAYYDRVSDLIYTDPALTANGKPYGFSNLLAATYRGFESTLKQKWGAGSNLILNYSRQYASCSVSGTLTNPFFLPTLQAIAATCPSMVPRNSGSVLLTQQVAENVQLSAGYYYQGPMQIIYTQAPEPLMRRLDLRAAKIFGKPGQSGGGEVALVVQNALREGYTAYTNVPQTRGQIIFNRRVYLTATLGF